MRKKMILAAAITGFVLSSPVNAQFSDSYNFLKAIRSRSEDGKKALDLMSKPGTVIIDTRDAGTGETALHIVTKDRDLPWINFLLARGARPDQRDAVLFRGQGI